MEGDQSAAEQGAAAMADEAMAADSTGAAAASTAANSSARVTQTPLGTQADDILIDNDEDDPLLGLTPSAPPLSILSKAAAGCWGGTQRENNRAVWSFFVPHDTSLPPDESRKSSVLCCWLCHLADTGGLHGSLPHEGPHALTDHERDVKTWADEAHLGGSSSARTARRGKGYVFNYSAGKGNSTLKDHIARYHRDLNVIYTDKVLNELPVSSTQPSKRTSQAASSELAAAGGTVVHCFRSSKKIKKDTLKARVFFQLLGLLMVYARLPFRLVDNPLFQSVCWFLDPSMPIPGRHE
eukprot:jgi/Tetstr1/426462/TSEL_016763.t1